MHISLKFEELHPSMETSWSDLRRIVAMTKQIYPKLNVEVHTEFNYATSFSVDPDREIMDPWSPVKVTIVPMTDFDNRDVNPQYSSIVKKLVSLITHFLAASHPFNDSSVQPSYFPDSEISISAGNGVSKFKNGEPDPYL